MRLLSAVAVLCLATSARADQCAVVTPEQAEAALRLLQPGVRYLEYCEPCGDKKPGPVRKVGVARKQPWSEPPLVVVQIDGEEMDLAYLFIAEPRDSHGRFVNMASLAKCPATDVSRVLDLDRLEIDRKAPAPSPVQATPAP